MILTGTLEMDRWSDMQSHAILSGLTISASHLLKSVQPWRSIMTDRSEPRRDVSQPTSVAATGGDDLTAIVTRCQKGDHRAMRSLYDVMKSPIFSYVLRFTGRVEDAEELVQDIFIKVFSGINSLQDSQVLKSWIFRIAINTCRDHARKGRIRRMFFSAPDLSETMDTSMSSDSLLSFRLNKAIEILPPTLKTAFLLHDVQGFTHQEIATMTGWSDGTSKSQLFKARKRLRRLLQGRKG